MNFPGSLPCPLPPLSRPAPAGAATLDVRALPAGLYLLRAGGATLNQTPLDWATNLANIRAAIDQARASGVEILCLPELCLTGYGCENLFLHPWVADAAEEHLRQLLPDTDGLCVVVGVPVRHGGGLAVCGRGRE